MPEVPLPDGAGLSERNRARLAALNRSLPGPFTADDAGSVLGVDHAEAARLLGHLASQGWLSRVRRGLFSVVPLDAITPSEWRADPWLVADRVFSPCYIGGWSACEQWDLTEQLFRSIVVVTAAPQRTVHQTIQGTEFRIAVRKPETIFGTRPVWRDRHPVQVSDPTRTIVDVLDDPGLGGGIRHVADVVVEYFASTHRDDGLLVEYGDRLGNRSVFKRLGYLIEQLGIEAPDLVAECAARRSAGLTKLDPTIRDVGRITRRWGLRVNAVLEPGPR